MKITKIEQDGDIFTVTREPRLIEKMVGIVCRTDRYKDTGFIYMFGGGHEYVNEKGESEGNTFSKTREAIDNWRRKF